MGCDIHIYREKKIGGKWVTADEWDPNYYDQGRAGVPYEKRAYTGRNYELFGLLSKGVRSEHPFSLDARGVPADMSPEVALDVESWNGDGHSHSHVTLQELKDLHARLANEMIKVDGMIDGDRLKQLRETIAAGQPDYKLLFPYCAWTSQASWVKFEQEVPAIWYFGVELDEIIKSFEGIDGEDHRFIFFFDN